MDSASSGLSWIAVCDGHAMSRQLVRAATPSSCLSRDGGLLIIVWDEVA